MKYNIFLLLLVFSLITIASASPYSLSTGSSPYSSNINQEVVINYSTIPTVNNSEYFDGYSTITYRTWLESYFDTVYASISSLANYLPLAGGTMAGDVNMGGNSITDILSLNFNITGCDGEVHDAGYICYNYDADTLSLITQTGQVIQIGREVSERGINRNGDSDNGAVIYLSGASGDNPEFKAADGSNVSESGMVGILTTDCLADEICPVKVFGFVNDIDTSAWAVTDKLYLNATSPGELTNIIPTLPNNPIWIATVIRSHATQGRLFVNPTIDPADGFLINSIYANGNVTADDFYIPNMTGNNGDYSINNWFINSGSPGQLTGGNISSGGGITIDVSAGTGLFRDTDDDTAQLRSYMWDARSSITVPTNSIMYVGVDLNSGTPIIVNTTTDASWDLDTNFPLGSVINQADEIYIMNNPWRVADGLTNVIERFQAEGWLKRDDNIGGLILGYTGTRQPTMTAGQLWSRINEHPFDAFVGGDTFDYYYQDGLGLEGYIENSDETQWSTSLWDNGSGTLDTIGNNKYAVIYVFANVASGKIALMYPQATYANAAGAEAETVPIFPGIWYKGGVIIGRIIIQEGEDIPVEIQSAFSTVFTASLAADHGNLAGLSDDDHPQYWISGTTRSGNYTTTENVIANYFLGNGSQLTGLPETNLTGYAKYQFENNNFNGNGNVTTLGNMTGTNLYTNKLYIADASTGAYRFSLEERPASANSRIMMYGYPDSGSAFGYVVSPKNTDSPTTSYDTYMNAWTNDLDDAGSTGGWYGGISVLGASDDGNVHLFSAVDGTGGTAGDIYIDTGSNTSAIFEETGDVIFPRGTTNVRDEITFFGTSGLYDMRVEVVSQDYLGNDFPTGAWRFVASPTTFPFDAGGIEFSYGSGYTNFYNNMAGYFSFEGAYSNDPVLTTPTSSGLDLRLDADGGYVYLKTTGKFGFGNLQQNTISYDGVRWLFDAQNSGNTNMYFNTEGSWFGKDVSGAGDPGAAIRIAQSVDLSNSGLPGFTDNPYGIYNSYDITNAANSSSVIQGDLTLVSYFSAFDMTSTGDAIRVKNNVLDLDNSAGGDIATSSITTSKLNGGLSYTGTAQINFFRAKNNGGDDIDMPNSNGYLMDSINATNFTGLNIGNITGLNPASIRTGTAPSYFGGTVYMNDINTTSGELNVYNSTGWAVVNAHDLVTHTFNETSNNPLETFIENNDLYKINTTLVDYSKPVEVKVEIEVCEVPTEEVCEMVDECSFIKDGEFYSKVCDKVEKCSMLPKQNCSMGYSYEPVYEIIENLWGNVTGDLIGYEKVKVEFCKDYGEVCENKTRTKTTYPYTIIDEGESYGQMVKDIEGVMVDLNRNTDLYENLTDFNTQIMAEDIFFQSKPVSPDVDYVSIFSDTIPFFEKHASKYTETFSLSDSKKEFEIQGDNVEDQIKDLQGYVLQNEFCRINNKKWDDYNSCMNNGETLGNKVK